MSDMTASLAAAGSDRSALRANFALATMLAGAFLTIMDVMIVNVALPGIRSDLGASFAQAQFVVAGYSLTYAIALITAGRLGDLFGRRRMFMLGLAGFTATSALCGLAPNAQILVAGRLLQGLTAAILYPQVLSLIRVTFAAGPERARAFAVWGAAAGFAGVIGQMLGGFLAEANLGGLGWRPLFLINIPIGVAALIASPRFIAESRSPAAQRLDLAGVAFGAIALGLLLYPLIEGREAGWPAWSLIMLALALPALAIFGLHQHRRSQRSAQPLLDTSLFGDRAFTIGLLLTLTFYSTLNSSFLAFAFFIQAGLHRSPFDAGLIFSTLAVAFAATSILSRRITAERRRFWLAIGAVVALIGSALAAATPFIAPNIAEAMIPAMVVIGVGEGLFMMQLLNAVISSIHDRHAGSAAGVLSTMQQVGGAIGVAIVGLLFFGALDRARTVGLADAAAYGQALAAAFAYCVAALAATLGLLAALPRASAQS